MAQRLPPCFIGPTIALEPDMDPESKNGTGTCPQPEPRELEPDPRGAAEQEKRRHRRKTRSKGKTPSRVPSQSRVEAREEFVDVQDIERDIAAGRDEESYDVERG